MPSDRQPGFKELTVKDAILEALFEEMARDDRVCIIGEDVGVAGGVFGQTKGLFEKFGVDRVVDTPISEPAIFGMTVGAAMAGLRPVVEIMFGDFITLVMDQLVNQAAKIHYMSAGGYTVPLVLRTAVGVGGNLGPQHSQSFHAWAAHVPGLKVVMPQSAADAKGMMKAAIRDNNPVVFIEDRTTYNVKGPVPDGDVTVPLGKANVVREGRDVTIVAVSRMVQIALKAAGILAADGIEAEVVDPRTIMPLDRETILASVRKTSRALVLDAGHMDYGVTGEIASLISEHAFDYLDAPVMRLAAPQVPIPCNAALEPLVVPNEQQIVGKIRAMLNA
ncbi:MAG TPA: alpha-ketoacid dehydrogenase subunit beta [Alphaproteobacteria bacterium]|jgi:pyruvate dehydrogenase E1 component beta subunit